VHSGWEKLSDEQLAKDCALPGGYLSGALGLGDDLGQAGKRC
jgi:hypothetical protein